MEIEDRRAAHSTPEESCEGAVNAAENMTTWTLRSFRTAASIRSSCHRNPAAGASGWTSPRDDPGRFLPWVHHKYGDRAIRAIRTWRVKGRVL